MMSKVLQINNQEILLDEQIITFTKSAYDFTNLNERNISISNRINLKNTAEVREILGHPERIDSNNSAFEQLFQVKYFDGTLIFSGVAEIQEVTKDNISIQLIDGSKELIEALKADVNELAIDTYDFTFNLTSYNALDEITSSIWVWPFSSMRVDRKQLTLSATENNLKWMRPMFSVKRILDLAFSEKGWTFDRTNCPKIDNILLSSNHDAFYVSSYLKEINATVNSGNYVSNLGTFTFRNAEVMANSDNIIVDGRKTRVRLRGNITTTGAATITVEYDTETQVFFINENDTEINFLSDKFESDTTGTIKIKVDGANVTFSNTRFYTIINEEDFGDLDSNPLLGFRVLTYENLGNYNQYDIWKHSIILFNAFFNTDRNTNTLTCEQIGSLDKLNSVDWSSKFIKESEDLRSDFLTLFKKSYLAYENDDTLPVYFGSHFININSDRLDDIGTILSIPFSASNDITVSSQQVAHLPIYGTNDDAIEQRLQNLDARLLYYTGSNLSRFKEISFSELATVEFKSLLSSLLRPRVIECDMLLNRYDVLSFNFTKLVYIEEFKSYFYLLNIDNFEQNRLTPVKLLKYG